MADSLSAPAILQRQREGRPLSAAQIQAFVDGVTQGTWSDAQVGAMAMAVVWRGLDEAGTVALTDAMTRSGEVLHWSREDFDRPVLDKHSTGGVGDKVSLMLAPIVAACGGLVPMISGRGLGHTGGTLDKLEALPGYQVQPSRERLLATLRDAGCAIVGASPQLAPADRRLYAIRDVTSTIASLPLITASILSKKRAAGLQALVLDVKFGSGAFMQSLADARELAQSLVRVSTGAGLPAQALLTDMDQPLGHAVGHALEVREAIDFLTGMRRESRLAEVTLALSARLIAMGGLARSLDEAQQKVEHALASGAAADCFARMVAGLGGPKDVLRETQLARAGIEVEVPAPRSGVIERSDALTLGLAVQALGGGRLRSGDQIDGAVGLCNLLPVGMPVQQGQPLARIHARSEDSAARAQSAVAAAFHIVDATAAGSGAMPSPLRAEVLADGTWRDCSRSSSDG